MKEFIITLLETSVAMSAIALVYMAMTPLLSKIIAAKGRYYAWLLIVLGLMIPFRFHPQAAVISLDAFMGNSLSANQSYGAAISSHIPWSVLFFVLWLTGTAAFLGFHTYRYIRFLKIVKRWSRPVTDGHTLKLLKDSQAELQIRGQVGLRVCPGISSPMLIGFIRPAILLPESAIPADELALIIRHELVHYKRKDVWYKALVLLAAALHWFNPFIHLVAREIAVQCEISCDDEVVKHSDANGRQKYVEAILGIIRKQSTLQSVLSTNFYSGKQGMKHRVYSIMDESNKKPGVFILAIIAAATLSTGMIVQINAPAPTTAKEVSNTYNAVDEISGKSLKAHGDNRPGSSEKKQFLDKEMDPVQSNTPTLVAGE